MMYDFLPNVVADYTATELSIPCQVEINETPQKKQVEFEFDDGSTDRLNLSDIVWFEGTLQWPNGLLQNDAETITDLYIDPAKADFGRRSIYWQHPVDGHTYVIKFMSSLTRKWAFAAHGFIQIPAIDIRIIGRKAGT